MPMRIAPLKVAVLCSHRAPGLVHLLNHDPRRGSEYEVVCCVTSSDTFAEEVRVERMTKKSPRTFDARAAIVSLDARACGRSCDRSCDSGHVTDRSCAILRVVLRHGTPSVRPDDVLAALREISGAPIGTAALAQRLAQGPLDSEDGTVGDPLTPDRDAAG